MQKANKTHTADFISIFSPNISQVRIENKIIPTPKPISLAGHTAPSYAAAIFSVPLIDQYEIIKPGIATNKALSLDHLPVQY